MHSNGKRATLVVLYGIGGLSDVGRHAILAAMERPAAVEKIIVITEYPELLDEENWECSCPGGHTNPTIKSSSPTSDELEVDISVVKINSWKKDQPNLKEHFSGADAVISCLGHRQPGLVNPKLTSHGLIAYAGNKQVIRAMLEAKVQRVVVCSSMGIEEDWPPMEFRCEGKIMALLFKTMMKSAFKDLSAMEVAYKEAAIEYPALDYLFVRPVGLGEEVVPVGKYFLQKEKGKDIVGANMAKMDCARFLVEEALNPTKHKRGIVIGSEPP